MSLVLCQNWIKIKRVKVCTLIYRVAKHTAVLFYNLLLFIDLLFNFASCFMALNFIRFIGHRYANSLTNNLCSFTGMLDQNFTLDKKGFKQAVVAWGKNACFKRDMTLLWQFESHSREDNLYGKIYMVAIAPPIIVVPLYSPCQRNMVSIP